MSAFVVIVIHLLAVHSGRKGGPRSHRQLKQLGPDPQSSDSTSSSDFRLFGVGLRSPWCLEQRTGPPGDAEDSRVGFLEERPAGANSSGLGWVEIAFSVLPSRRERLGDFEHQEGCLSLEEWGSRWRSHVGSVNVSRHVGISQAGQDVGGQRWGGDSELGNHVEPLTFK